MPNDKAREGVEGGLSLTPNEVTFNTPANESGRMWHVSGRWVGQISLIARFRNGQEGAVKQRLQ